MTDWAEAGAEDVGSQEGRRAFVPAWLLSLVFHLLAILLLSLFFSTATPRSTEPWREAGITLVTAAPPSPPAFTDAEAAETSAQAAEEEAAPASSLATDRQLTAALHPLPGADQPPVDPPLLPGRVSADYAPLADSMTAVRAGILNSTAGSPRRALGKGSSVTTGFFGVQATGTRFVYLIDRSGSMAEFSGRPMSAAKSQLRQSLQKLDRVHQFQVVFYNQRPSVFNPYAPQPPRMMYGSEQEKAWAEDFIERIEPFGGTDHIQALQWAIYLQPDVIFLLTDADEPQLSPEELDRVRQRNPGAVIHTVEFGHGPRRSTTSFLQLLAQQNSGTYAYVDVTQLPDAR